MGGKGRGVQWLACLLLASACSSSGGQQTPAPGTAGGACLPGGACNAALECKGGTCSASSSPTVDAPTSSLPDALVLPDARLPRPMRKL